MKKLNKKGFTIIELVIVIAVIAILAAVLIPTFSSVIKNANESSAMQACSAAYTEALADAFKDGKVTTDEVCSSSDGKWTFKFAADTAGAVIGVTLEKCPAQYKDYFWKYENNSWKASSTDVTGYAKATSNS